MSDFHIIASKTSFSKFLRGNLYLKIFKNTLSKQKHKTHFIQQGLSTSETQNQRFCSLGLNCFIQCLFVFL